MVPGPQNCSWHQRSHSGCSMRSFSAAFSWRSCSLCASCRLRPVQTPSFADGHAVPGAVTGPPCGPAARMACLCPATARCRQAGCRGPLIRLPGGVIGVRRLRAAAQAAPGALRSPCCSRFSERPSMHPVARAGAAEGFADRLVVHCGGCSLSRCSNDGCPGAPGDRHPTAAEHVLEDLHQALPICASSAATSALFLSHAATVPPPLRYCCQFVTAATASG